MITIENCLGDVYTYYGLKLAQNVCSGVNDIVDAYLCDSINAKTFKGLKTCVDLLESSKLLKISTYISTLKSREEVEQILTYFKGRFCEDVITFNAFDKISELCSKQIEYINSYNNLLEVQNGFKKVS